LRSHEIAQFLSTLAGKETAEAGNAIAVVAEMSAGMDVYPMDVVREVEHAIQTQLLPPDEHRLVDWAERCGIATIDCTQALPGSLIAFSNGNLNHWKWGIITKLDGVRYESAEHDGVMTLHHRAWGAYGPVGVPRVIRGKPRMWTKCILPIDRLLLRGGA
jgi:hypothetical protein